MLAGPAVLPAVAQEAPRFPPHYAGQATTCPLGGGASDAPALVHYSTSGSLAGGQPAGSIAFPILLPGCPANGLAKESAETRGMLCN